ncbi:MAG: hypothetical protein J6K15_05160 [Lachnospiraceae bacterium]|nr:hypothetical protein [Lachnospiraceae bacterium]
MNGYTKIKSVTKEMKATVKNQSLRKNITKIWLVEDEETKEKGFAIFFKEETVKNQYSGEYIEEYTVAPSEDINGWLDEVAEV